MYVCVILLRFVCMRAIHNTSTMHTCFYVFPCSSVEEIGYMRYKNLMRNFHFASRPKFYALSNWTLVFAVSPILCRYRKMNTTTHRNSASIQPAISAYRNQVTGKTNAPFESITFWSRKRIKILHYLVFVNQFSL